MATERLDVRLDPERQRRLREIAARREQRMSDVVRQWIDAAYEEILAERRRRAVDEIAKLSFPVPDDPDAIKRDLLTLHDLPDLR